MKIFLTGQKQIGKSTCIQECIRECHKSVCGFLTLPFYEEQRRAGFYLHALHAMEHNDQRFSGVFNSFGTQLLQQACRLQEHILILDEIGHLEQKETIYLQTLLDSIDKFPNILGVLKKYDIQYIHEIAARKDVIVFDLDVMAYEDVKKYILKAMGG
jgi:nucleoside-triphosphatase